MIEHIQKYKIVITISIVAVAAGFVLGGSSLMKRASGGVAVLRVAGRTYDNREFQRLGTSSLELISTLARTGDFGLYEYMLGLGVTGEKDAAEKFFVGRMILRQAQEEFGVYPGDEEISEYLRSLRSFADKSGKFDEALYRNFVEKGIGRLGLTERDLRDLAADVLASKKIHEILGAGLGVNREIAAQVMAFENEQISGATGRLDLDPFEAKIEPTDEQIKAFWENIQDAFNTEPLRKFSYVIVTPEAVPDAPAEEAESITDAAATDEVKKAAAKKKQEEKAKRDAEVAEKRRQKQIEVDKLVDDFSFELENQHGEGFEELAKANKWEVKTTELFPASKPPAELDVKLRSSSRGGKATDELFRIEPLANDAMSKIAQPIAIGQNQWLIARLDGEEKSRPKTYEEAKDEARAKYIAEKAGEAMKAAANDAVTKIKEALAANKPFAEAAKDAGIAEVKEFDKVNSTYRADTSKEPRNLFEVARNVDPGGLAEPVFEADRAFVVYVAKREVVKQPDAATRLDQEVTKQTKVNQTIAFNNWMAQRTEAAKVEQLYKR